VLSCWFVEFRTGGSSQRQDLVVQRLQPGNLLVRWTDGRREADWTNAFETLEDPAYGSRSPPPPSRWQHAPPKPRRRSYPHAPAARSPRSAAVPAVRSRRRASSGHGRRASIGLDSLPAVNHQPEFTAACITPAADRAMHDGALAMAWTAIDMACDETIRHPLMTAGGHPSL
jgi:hypothetical protein